MKHCPHCGGDLSMYQAAELMRNAPPASASSATTPVPLPVAPVLEAYNQTKVWKDLIARVSSQTEAPGVHQLVRSALERFSKLYGIQDGTNIDTIVHLVFDREIVPQGGVLYKAMITEGRATLSVEQLEAMGYLVVDGKIVEADGAPVSRAWGALNYWGGDKQFKRWHLTGPVQVNASRNGNPFFMDAEMIAFGARWRDLTKAAEALINLLLHFDGSEDKMIAAPVALEITPR